MIPSPIENMYALYSWYDASTASDRDADAKSTIRQFYAFVINGVSALGYFKTSHSFDKVYNHASLIFLDYEWCMLLFFRPEKSRFC